MSERRRPGQEVRIGTKLAEAVLGERPRFSLAAGEKLTEIERRRRTAEQPK